MKFKEAQSKSSKLNPDYEVLEIIHSLSNSDVTTQEEKDFVAGKIDVKRVKKGVFLLEEGQIIRSSYHLFKGCIREYHLKDGEEKTVAFYTSGDSLSGGSDPLKEISSSINWECMSECIISIFPFAVERELHKRFPRLDSLCRIETEKHYFNYRSAINTYLSSSPAERYENLIKTKPELFQLVPLYHIASYLGVKPESLSRIRSRLSST